MNEDTAAWPFFRLVLIFSLPFYLLGVLGNALPLASTLPLSALMAIVPMIAAMALVFRQHGAMAAGQLFKSAFEFRLIPNIWWVILAIAFMPVAFALTAGLIWLSGAALPPMHWLSISAIVPAFMLFFFGAVGEELGWQGYVYPRLIKQYSALNTALIIGVVWALWHVIPFALMGRSAAWIFWQGAGMVLMRIIIVWLVLNIRGSILIAVLFHMMSNSVWGMFTDFAPYCDPMLMCVVLLIAVAVFVRFPAYDQRALRQKRSGKSQSIL